MTKTSMTSRVSLGLALAASLSVGYRGLSAQDQQPQDAQAAAMARLLESKACAGCDLAGATFDKDANLKGLDLAGAKLAGASFYRTNLTGSNFSDADLSKTNFSMADLTNVNFGNANLDGANFAGATAASLTGAKTTSTTVCPDGQVGPCR
jgi:uncharacterized protein YjbI with pentapeptide repeats